MNKPELRTVSPATNNDDESCDESIGLLISRCLNRLADATAELLPDIDLNTQQFGVLHSVFRGRATTPSALARLCFTNTAAITYTLDVLEKKGLLLRKRSSSDRRVIELELTEQGEALIKAFLPKVRAAQHQLLSPLSPAECQLLQTLLQRIANQD